MVSCTVVGQVGDFLRILPHTGHFWQNIGTRGMFQSERACPVQLMQKGSSSSSNTPSHIIPRSSISPTSSISLTSAVLRVCVCVWGELGNNSSISPIWDLGGGEAPGIELIEHIALLGLIGLLVLLELLEPRLPPKPKIGRIKRIELYEVTTKGTN